MLYNYNTASYLLKNSIGHFILSYVLILSLLFGVGVKIDDKNSSLINNMYFQIPAVFLFILFETGNIFMDILAVALYYYLLYKSESGKKFYDIKSYNFIKETLFELGLDDNNNFNLNY